VPMTSQKLVVLFTSLTGGAIGLFAPIGVVKWLLQTEPEDAGILTLFFFPVWCLLFALGILIGRRLGLLMTGGKRVLQR
jgi:DMSO reductase anchor subunit